MGKQVNMENCLLLQAFWDITLMEMTIDMALLTLNIKMDYE